TIWYDNYKLTTRLALGDTTVWMAATWAGEGVMVATDVTEEVMGAMEEVMGAMEEVMGTMEATVAWEWAAEDSKTSSSTGNGGRQYGF
ncbi:MAG: hypothetical protein Q9180_007574, partial [Flavoplaca navasiana]